MLDAEASMADRDQKKSELTEVQSGKTAGGKSDVFDKMGNSALREKVAEVESQTGTTLSKESEKNVLAQASEKLQQTEKKAETPAEQAEEALRAQALEARDEVILRLQQISGSPDQLQAIQGAGSMGQAAAQVVERLVAGMAEQDLAALSAYDHDDLLTGKILSSESWLETRGLSTQAARLGAFAPALWQLVADQLESAGVSFGEGDDLAGGAAQTASLDASGDPRNLSGPLLRVANVLRAARSSTIV
jgi:hypothetical protein